jgi:hypothetical protein
MIRNYIFLKPGNNEGKTKTNKKHFYKKFHQVTAPANSSFMAILLTDSYPSIIKNE